MKTEVIHITPQQLLQMTPKTLEEYRELQRALKERRREQDALLLGDGTPEKDQPKGILASQPPNTPNTCLLYTSDAADE